MNSLVTAKVVIRARNCIICGETFPQFSKKDLERHAIFRHGLKRGDWKSNRGREAVFAGKLC